MTKQEDPGKKSKDIAEDEVRDGGDGGVESTAPAGSSDGRDEKITAAENEPGGEDFQLAPEELPTMQWSDVYAELAEFEDLEINSTPPGPASSPTKPQSSETGPLDGLEDAMAWLEELAAGQGMPIDEMPTLVSTRPDAADLPPKEEPRAGEPDGDEQDALAISEDSDPMAWLEQLAVDQSSPLEELPSVADRLLASEIISQPAIPPDSTINDPRDIDEALKYLEQEAEKHGIDLSAVEFDANQPLDNLKAALSIIDGLALTGLAARSAVAEKEDAADVIEDAQASIEPEILIELFDEVPDEVDDADDKESESAGIVDTSLLAEEGEEAGPGDRKKEADLSAGMPDDPDEALEWLIAIGETDEDTPVDVIVEQDTVAIEADQEPPGEETVDEKEMPAEDAGQFDGSVLKQMPDDPDEAVAWMEKLARQGTQDVDDAGEEQSSKEKRPSRSAGPAAADEEATLAALAGGDLEEVVVPLQAILDNDAVTPELAAALENALEQHQDSPRLLRLLGDAYMQIGQVDKAVATYRRGFDHL